VKNLHMLLVDDETEFLSLVTRRMARRGVEVTSAESGEQALELLENEEFDVVVLDVRMPGMDGIETLRRIKARHPGTEVVLLTGHADTSSAYTGMQLGAFDYMIKPVAFDELFAKIRDAALVSGRA